MRLVRVDVPMFVPASAQERWMPAERVIREYETDDDAVVASGGSGSSAGVILGIAIVLLILAAVWWFALGPGAGTTPAA